MWLLAIKAMLADRGKLMTSLLGIAFSVVLVNLQGGLLLGLIQKASLLVDYGQADIWVGHRHMTNVDMGTFIPERWIHRIRSVEGVREREPYVVSFGQATMPDGRYENVMVVGSDPASLMGNAWVMDNGDPRAVRQPDGVLVDVCDLDRLGNPRIGDVREINGQRVRIVGMTRGIVSFTTNPYVFTTLDRARNRYTLGMPSDVCSYFLVKAKPGVDPKELSQRIRERVPNLDVYDRQTYSLDVHGVLADAHRAGHQFRPGGFSGTSGWPGGGRPDLVRLGQRTHQGVRHAQGDGGGRSLHRPFPVGPGDGQRPVRLAGRLGRFGAHRQRDEQPAGAGGVDVPVAVGSAWRWSVWCA